MPYFNDDDTARLQALQAEHDESQFDKQCAAALLRKLSVRELRILHGHYFPRCGAEELRKSDLISEIAPVYASREFQPNHERTTTMTYQLENVRGCNTCWRCGDYKDAGLLLCRPCHRAEKQTNGSYSQATEDRLAVWDRQLGHNRDASPWYVGDDLL